MSARTTTPGTLTAEDVYFAQIPEWVLFHPALSGNAVRLYGVLKRHANSIDRCWPGLETLGRETATSRSTVQRSLKELEAVGAVEITPQFTKGQQTVNLYHVKWTQPGTTGGWPAGDTTPPAAGQGGPAGDTPRGPSVTCRGPAGDTQTIAMEPEPPEREVADPSDRATPAKTYPHTTVTTMGRPPTVIDVQVEAPPTSPRSAPPPSSPGYADWEVLAGALGWNPKLNVGLNLRVLKELHAAGVTAEQIIGCVEWLRADPWWQARGVDLKKAASKMQDYLSKELRTPTRAIDGYAEMMRDPTLARIFGED